MASPADLPIAAEPATETSAWEAALVLSPSLPTSDVKKNTSLGALAFFTQKPGGSHGSQKRHLSMAQDNRQQTRMPKWGASEQTFEDGLLHGFGIFHKHSFAMALHLTGGGVASVRPGNVSAHF